MLTLAVRRARGKHCQPATAAEQPVAGDVGRVGRWWSGALGVRPPRLNRSVRPLKVKMNVDLAHALYAIGRLPGESLPELASELLSKGIDTSAVRELAGLRRPTVRDAGPVFERVLADLGRPTMPVTMAAQVIAVDLARRVVAGEMSPRDAA